MVSITVDFTLFRGSVVASMIKDCHRFHFRIFRHGFLISKNVPVDTEYYPLLAKTKRKYINFCYLICRRVVHLPFTGSHVVRVNSSVKKLTTTQISLHFWTCTAYNTDISECNRTS